LSVNSNSSNQINMNLDEFYSKINRGELTLKQIQRFLIDNGARCWNCGRKYRGGEIKAYPHEGGYSILVRNSYTKKKRRMWVYMLCKKCGYQTALWKIITLGSILDIKEVD